MCLCLNPGGCKGRFNAVFDWIRKEKTPYGEVVIRFNTYFMRDGWYWLYENRNNRTRYGDPVALQIGWRGIPMDGVDAYVHVWSRKKDAVYFFKGRSKTKYYPRYGNTVCTDTQSASKNIYLVNVVSVHRYSVLEVRQ